MPTEVDLTSTASTSVSTISKGNKIEVYLLTSAEDLYEHLAEESEGFSLIARIEPLTN